MGEECIDDREMIAFVMGRLTADMESKISNHLLCCQRCYSRLVKIHSIHNGIIHYFRSIPKSENCPEVSAWKDYLESDLENPQRERMRVHLTECDRCFDMVSSMLRAEVHQWDLHSIVEDLKSNVGKIHHDAKEKLCRIGNWLGDILVPNPPSAYAGIALQTRGYVKSQGDIRISKEPTVDFLIANFFDSSVSPAVKTVVFKLISGPEIDKNRRFRMELSTSSLEYKGFSLEIALSKGIYHLHLGSVALESSANILRAAISVNLSQTSVNFEEAARRLPASLIELSLYRETSLSSIEFSQKN